MANETTIPIVRHVPTVLNENGISRGWTRNGPDPEKLEELGPGIADTLKKLNVAELRSSDLPRAAKTAEWLGRELDIPVETTPKLRTWNTGDKVAGRPESETIPLRQKYLKYPEETPPGGEPFQRFIDRAAPELRDAEQFNRAHPDAPRALVLHGHHVLAAEEALNGEDVDPAELEKLDTEFPPGSVSLLRVGGDRARLERVHPAPGTQEKAS